MLNFLSFETCSSNQSVSLFIDNKHVDLYQLESKNSSQLPYVTKQILINNKVEIDDLNYIAVTIGPGSFTGIRVGLSLVQGLCFSSKLQIAPINILEVLSCNSEVEKGSLVGLYSHGDFIFCRYKNRKTIQLLDVNTLKGKSIAGLGLDRFKEKIQITGLECSSKDIGEYAIKNYRHVICEDIGRISPIYLNEYKVKINS